MINENNKSYAADLERVKIEVPALYKVFLHNDDYTPMEFVTGLLERFFYLDRRKAIQVMMEIHQQGLAACGLFTKDVAETKISLVTDYAVRHEHPLLCSMESA